MASSVSKVMIMNTASLAFIGMWEAILIMAVLLIFFGAKKLPEMAKGLGQGIREFKKASNEITNDLNRAIEEEPVKPVAKAVPAPEHTTPAASSATPSDPKR